MYQDRHAITRNAELAFARKWHGRTTEKWAEPACELHLGRHIIVEVDIGLTGSHVRTGSPDARFQIPDARCSIANSACEATYQQSATERLLCAATSAAAHSRGLLSTGAFDHPAQRRTGAVDFFRARIQVALVLGYSIEGRRRHLGAEPPWPPLATARGRLLELTGLDAGADQPRKCSVERSAQRAPSGADLTLTCSVRTEGASTGSGTGRWTLPSRRLGRPESESALLALATAPPPWTVAARMPGRRAPPARATL